MTWPFRRKAESGQAVLQHDLAGHAAAARGDDQTTTPGATSAWKGAAPLEGEHVNYWDEPSGVEVELPTDVVAVASGGGHCLALRSNGTVVGWGANNFGQADVPAGLMGVTAIAAGSSHSLALRADGTVVAWGSDLNGQASVPAGTSNVVAIFAGGQESAVFLRDGSLVAWGAIGSTVGRARPTGGPFTAVGLGDTHFLVLDADGDLSGRSFELESVYKPVAPPRRLSGFEAVAVGSGFCLAMKNDGALLAWGRNDYGQATVPSGLARVKAISAGGSVSLALRNDGTVVNWGGPDADDGEVPMPDGLTNVTAIAAGVQCVALRADGSVVLWGDLHYAG